MIVAFIVSGAFGWLNDAALWRPLRRRGTGLIAMMIVSIGLSIFLRSIFQYFAGAPDPQLLAVLRRQAVGDRTAPGHPEGARGRRSRPWRPWSSTTALLQYTRLGKATRAVADNPALSSATGINVERVINMVWIGGAALAGLAGALLGLTQGFDYQIGFKILLLVFAAVVLGGLGTIWGAILGAFVIGLFIELPTLFIPAEFKFVGALLVLIIVLLIRPRVCSAGPSGSAEGRRRHGLRRHPRASRCSRRWPHRHHLLPGGDRPQRAFRLHRTAELRPGRLHDGRRLRVGSR